MKRSVDSALIAATGWIVLLLAINLTACARSEPEQEIREHIAAIQTAIEDRNASDVSDYLAEGFLANGHIDKQSLYRFLVAQFLGHNKITAAVTRLEIGIDELNPYRARMEGTGLVAGAEHWLPTDGNLVTFEGEWSFIEGEWRLSRLDWK